MDGNRSSRLAEEIHGVASELLVRLGPPVKRLRRPLETKHFKGTIRRMFGRDVGVVESKTSLERVVYVDPKYSKYVDPKYSNDPRYSMYVDPRYSKYVDPKYSSQSLPHSKGPVPRAWLLAVRDAMKKPNTSNLNRNKRVAGARLVGAAKRHLQRKYFYNASGIPAGSDNNRLLPRTRARVLKYARTRVANGRPKVVTEITEAQSPLSNRFSRRYMRWVKNPKLPANLDGVAQLAKLRPKTCAAVTPMPQTVESGGICWFNYYKYTKEYYW